MVLDKLTGIGKSLCSYKDVRVPKRTGSEESLSTDTNLIPDYPGTRRSLPILSSISGNCGVRLRRLMRNIVVRESSSIRIAIQSDSRQALDILNRIVAVAWLSGLEVLAVRDWELGTCQIDPVSQTISGWSQTEVLLRTQAPFPGNVSRLDIEMMRFTREQVIEDAL